MIKWRATVKDKDCDDMQLTFVFEAPFYNDNFNYKLLAKLALIKEITFGEQIQITNVEPIEQGGNGNASN